MVEAGERMGEAAREAPVGPCVMCASAGCGKSASATIPATQGRAERETSGAPSFLRSRDENIVAKFTLTRSCASRGAPDFRPIGRPRNPDAIGV